MANFLDSLRTLFKMSGTQALPSGSQIVVTLSQESGNQYYTAPRDGWLRVSLSNGGYYLNIQRNDIAVGFATTCYGKDRYLVQSIPMRKGDVAMVGGDTQSVGSFGATFTPTVGSQ